MHKNSIKRCYDKDLIYFIVTKTYKNYPFFNELVLCDLFIEQLKLCKALKKFKLYAFSIVHDHLNLLLRPADKYNISQVLFSLKKQFAHNANRVLGFNDIVGEQALVRLQSDSKHHLQIENVIKKYKQQLFQKYGPNQVEIPLFQWQKSFYDHVIRGRKDFEIHWNYTVDNPIKHGLNEDWQHTSSNYQDLLDEIYI